MTALDLYSTWQKFTKALCGCFFARKHELSSAHGPHLVCLTHLQSQSGFDWYLGLQSSSGRPLSIY